MHGHFPSAPSQQLYSVQSALASLHHPSVSFPSSVRPAFPRVLQFHNITPFTNFPDHIPYKNVFFQPLQTPAALRTMPQVCPPRRHPQSIPSYNIYQLTMLGDEDYFLPSRIIERLQAKIQQRADHDHQQWLFNYLKQVTPVRGVRMQEIRYLLHQWYQEWTAEQQTIPVETERAVAFQMLQAQYLEDKLAAIIYFSEMLIPTSKISHTHLPLFEQCFTANHLTNYKVCDNFAQKVLVPLLLADRDAVTARLQNFWYSADSMWQARAALAALSTLAPDGTHDETIIAGCHALVQRPEEEAKSIVGTALKALSKNRPERVTAFLQRDDVLGRFDAPSLSKAASNLDARLVARLKTRRRALQSAAAASAAGGTDAGGGGEYVDSGGGSGAASAADGSGSGVGSGVPAAVAGGPGVGGPGDPLGMAVRDPLGVGVTLGGEMTFGSVLEGHVEQAALATQGRLSSPTQMQSQTQIQTVSMAEDDGEAEEGSVDKSNEGAEVREKRAEVVQPQEGGGEEEEGSGDSSFEASQEKL